MTTTTDNNSNIIIIIILTLIIQQSEKTQLRQKFKTCANTPPIFYLKSCQ